MRGAIAGLYDIVCYCNVDWPSGAGIQLLWYGIYGIVIERKAVPSSIAPPKSVNKISVAFCLYICLVYDDFGGFNFVDGSKLSITTNGHNVNIGGIYLTDGASNYEVEIYNLTDFTLKIGSLDNIATEVDEEGFLRTTEGFMVSSDDTYLDYAYLVEAGDGGYWVNVTSVPEPAECALVFGSLACALALAKRRFRK